MKKDKRRLLAILFEREAARIKNLLEVGCNEMKASVIGRQMNFEHLTVKVTDREYIMMTIKVWLHMLGNRMKPTKWLKLNKNGPKINFEHTKGQEDCDRGVEELDVYQQEMMRLKLSLICAENKLRNLRYN